MKERLSNNKGNTLVELIMVMMLLVLFGATIYTLIYTGSETQKKIIEEKNAQIDARIALSYINMRIRQNDVQDKVFVENNELTGKSSIVIKERGSEYQYDTWIFWLDGNLMECLVDPEEQPALDKAEKIAQISGFDTLMDEEGAIKNTIYYRHGNVEELLSSVVYLRSEKSD